MRQVSQHLASCLTALALLCCSPQPKELQVADTQALPEPTVPTASTTPAECLKLAPLLPLRFTGAGRDWGDNLEARLDTELGGEGAEKLSIRFPANAGIGVVPGTFTLGVGANARAPTCLQCVTVLEDQNGVNLGRLNFATAGTLELDAVNAIDGEYRGRLKNVVLRALLPSDAEGGWDGLDSGFKRCLLIEDAPFDTFADRAESCTSSEQCVNEKKQVCDPATGRCVANQCSEGPMCPPDLVCKVQHVVYETGACYVPCQPFSSAGCTDGRECVSIRYDGSLGVCKPAGFAAIGQKECVASTLTTGCRSGAVCQASAPLWPREQYCVQTCNYFSDAPGCARGVCQLILYGEDETRQHCGGGRCHLGGTCTEAGNVDAAAIGENCSSPGDSPCAPQDGLKARGLCDHAVCREVCALKAPSCPLGTTCVQHTTQDSQNSLLEGVGVCR